MIVATLFEKLVWLGAAVLALPILINPGAWVVAAVLVGLWLLLWYGGRYWLDLQKYRLMGAKGAERQRRELQRRRRHLADRVDPDDGDRR